MKMRNKKKFLILLFSILLYEVSIICHYKNSSAMYVFKGAYAGDDYLGSMLWFFLFVCISFYFLGVVEEYFNGFGIYELVRSKNRSIILLRQYWKLAVELFIILLGLICIIFVMSLIFNGGLDGIAFDQFVLSFIMYYSSVYLLLLIQLFLELFFKAQIALLMVNTYVVASIAFAGVLFKFEKVNILLYFLIPNFAMAQRTTILNKGNFTIIWGSALVIIASTIAAVIMLSIEKIKIKDTI